MIGIGVRGVGVAGGLSLTARAISTLRRLGATLIGVNDNFAGTYIDSTGTTPVTAVGDLVGLTLDRRGTVGAELAPATFNPYNSTLTNGGAAPSVATSTVNGNYGFRSAGLLVIGKTYRVSVTWSGNTNNRTLYCDDGFDQSGASSNAATGTLTHVFRARLSDFYFYAVNAVVGNALSLATISVRELTGNHATQATTASKPLVTRVPKRLGPNLVSNGSITGLPAGGGTRFYNMTGAMTPLVANKTYLMTYTVSGYSGTGNVGIAGAAPAGIVQTNDTANGSYRVVQTPTAGGVILFYTTNTNTANFSAIEIREVLEWTNAISFDGSNDFLQTGITTGNEGWVCAGVTQNVGTTCYPAAAGGLIDASAGANLRLINGITPQIQLGDGTLRQLLAADADVTLGTPFVYSGGWNGSTLLLGVNNTEKTAARTRNPTSATTWTIGAAAAGTGPMSGPMTCQVISPTLPSAADRALIRKWIGSLQGQTL